MKRRIIGAFCLILLAGCARHHVDWESPYRELSSLREGEILHLSTGVTVSKEELIDMLDGVRVVYVGEAHDNMKCHEVQLKILQALSERYPGEVALGMEMLQRPSQDAADQWIAGELDEKSFFKIWADNWSNDFDYYRDILRYVRDHNIPLIALRASDDWMEEARQGSNTGPPEEKEEAIPELDLADPYHRSHIESVFQKHPHKKQDFDAFYRVQVLWDESMAQSIAEFLESDEGRDKRVVVFAGGHHVQYGYGIPRRLFRRFPLPYAIVLPTTVRMPPDKRHKVMPVTFPEIPFRPGDFAWIVGYEDLTEKKVSLGVMIRDTDDGLKVMGILKNSTAKKIGLKKEDIITAMDGEPIQTRFDLTYLIGMKKPGDQGIIEVLRDNEPLSFDVTFETRKKLAAPLHGEGVQGTRPGVQGN
jgi:uncharacterized iron-regulated protein